ncbi:hypothetical protein [Vibrio coralliilyticus]|uniref:Uncharacterized protein n=1 Tax=Vibrio coralliilyticus TaxID=190893 RepID=A0AAP7DFS1_9VIBR|nr:hypothetical protein [Vibrio coralliilyticus]NOJ26334.1 hypothetical protein [Vibrio coralliilyticus]
MKKQIRKSSATLAQCNIRNLWMSSSGAKTTDERKQVIKVWRHFVESGLMDSNGNLQVPSGSHLKWQSVEAYYKDRVDERV